MPLTPPTLTAPTSSNRIVDDIVVTFTDSAPWRAAITAVKIDGVTIAVLARTIAAGSITFGNTYRTFDESRDNYALTVVATGYTDATATISIAVAPWNLLSLYQVTPTDDLAAEESVMVSLLAYTGADYTTQHANVKDEIEEALVNYFVFKQKTLRDTLDDQNFQILDHIINPNKLKRLAVRLALYRLFNAQIITGDDSFGVLAKKYWQEYQRSLAFVHEILRFDTTVVDDSEQNYGIPRLVR